MTVKELKDKINAIPSEYDMFLVMTINPTKDTAKKCWNNVPVEDVTTQPHCFPYYKVDFIK